MLQVVQFASKFSMNKKKNTVCLKGPKGKNKFYQHTFVTLESCRLKKSSSWSKKKGALFFVSFVTVTLNEKFKNNRNSSFLGTSIFLLFFCFSCVLLLLFDNRKKLLFPRGDNLIKTEEDENSLLDCFLFPHKNLTKT